jgi:hypothetical protein
MTIELHRNRPALEYPLPAGSYLTLLRRVLAVLALGAASWGIASAGEPQPQYHGFTPAGAAAANFGQAKQELLSALSDCRRPGFIGPRVVRSPRNIDEFYPTEAQHQGEQAVVVISFLDDSLGNLRFPHVGRTFPIKAPPALVAAAIKLMRGYAVTPSSLNGEPISSWGVFPIRFILRDVGGPMGSLLNQDAWLAMLDKANAGDVPSILYSGYVAEIVPTETGLSGPATWSLIIDSALQGADFARMQLYDLLSACSRESVVEPWVAADAKAGSLQAEMNLAQTMWAGMLAKRGEVNQTENLSELLHTVAGGADPFYRLWAAGVLATEPGQRDPATALKVALALNDQPGVGHQYDPDYGELLAAAQAANGHFGAAVHSEQQAIQWAQRDGWNLKMMESRLTTYQAQRPWFGHLCDCQQIAPDVNAGLE